MPWRTWSSRRAARRDASFCWASVGGAAAASFLAWALAALAARLSCHSVTHCGGSASVTVPAAHISSSPSACLQGNLRLGHEHLYAGSSRSTIVWYGFAPEPLQRPHRLAGGP